MCVCFPSNIFSHITLKKKKRAETFFSSTGSGRGQEGLNNNNNYFQSWNKIISGLCILGDGPSPLALWTNISWMDIYAPLGGRCNKREEDGGKQTCCTWLGDSDLRGLGLNFSLNNQMKINGSEARVPNTSWTSFWCHLMWNFAFVFPLVAGLKKSPKFESSEEKVLQIKDRVWTFF